MINFKIEFGDNLLLCLTTESRLELTLLDSEGRKTPCWLDAAQVDKLIMELKILKANVKYPDKRAKL